MDHHKIFNWQGLLLVGDGAETDGGDSFLIVYTQHLCQPPPFHMEKASGPEEFESISISVHHDPYLSPIQHRTNPSPPRPKFLSN